MAKRIHVAIIEPSVIIRNGLVITLKNLTALHIDIFETANVSNYSHLLLRIKPNIVIINPSYIGPLGLSSLKKEIKTTNVQFVALAISHLDNQLIKQFDQVINITDSQEEIKEKLIKLSNNNINTNKKELSVREKEVIVLLVKGMTNKEIANELCLSIHTVITHRRNIATKLQIHSTAGLTIYAIVNKLVELNEIKT